MSIIDTILEDGAPLLVEELPALERLAEMVADAIATKKASLGQAAAQTAVAAADIAADVIEEEKFGPKGGTT